MKGNKMPEDLVVSIVDDDVSVRRSTRRLLDSSFGLPVCSTFSMGLPPVP
jgi:FixJ family two-component response regulator